MLESKSYPLILAVIYTFLIILIFGLPHILIPRFLNGLAYAPLSLNSEIPFYTVDETFAYATKVQRSLKEGFFLKDVQIIENGSLPNLFITESFSSYLMAVISKIFGSVSNGFIAADFLFPAFNYLIVFVLLYLFTKDRPVSIVGSFFLINCFYLLKTVQFPVSFLLRLIDEIKFGSLLPFSRSFHPQITFLFFIASIIAFYMLVKSRKIVYSFVLGFFLGLLGYCYIYYFAYIFTFFILFFMYHLLKKDWLLSKYLIISGFILTLMMIPVVSEFYRFIIIKPAYENFKENFVNPADNNFWLNFKIIIMIVVLYIFKKRDRAVFSFLNLLLISGLFLCNLQYVLNKNIHLSGHIEIRVIYPLLVICLFVVFSKININKYLKRFILIFLFLFSFFYGFLNHYSYSRSYYNSYNIPNSEIEVYYWLNNNTDKRSVVLSASLRSNMMISSLTHNYVFIPHSFLTHSTNEEILERLFIAHKLFKMDSSSIDELFVKNIEKEENILKRRWNFETCGHWFVFFTRYSNGNYYQCFIPDEENKKIVLKYQNFNLDKATLNKYKFDYILVGPYEKKWIEDIDFKEYLTLEKVFENKDYLIFKR